MKYKILTFIWLATILFSACQDEEKLEPSYKDGDRVAELADLSKPLVKKLYEDYGKGLLYEFNDTLDFMYIAATKSELEKWLNVSLQRLEESDIDNALNYLDTTLFSYLKEEISFNGITYNSDYFLQSMPYKMLMCSEISSTSQGLMSELTESDARSSDDGTGILHAIGNDHAFAFNIDLDVISTSAEKVNEYRNDVFYLLLVHTMDLGNMYESIPSSFYDVSNEYFDEVIGDVYESEGYTIDDYGLVDKEWFFEKGFVDARYAYSSEGLKDLTINDSVYVKVVDADDSFLENEIEFANSYINEMIFTNSNTLSNYPEIIQEKFKTIIETFLSWGIDIVAFNPELEILFEE